MFISKIITFLSFVFCLNCLDEHSLTQLPEEEWDNSFNFMEKKATTIMPIIVEQNDKNASMVSNIITTSQISITNSTVVEVSNGTTRSLTGTTAFSTNVISSSAEITRPSKETTSPSIEAFNSFTETINSSKETTSPSTEATISSTKTNNPTKDITSLSIETTSPSIKAFNSSTETINSSKETTSPSTGATMSSTKTNNSSREITSRSTETNNSSTEIINTSTEITSPSTKTISPSTETTNSSKSITSPLTETTISLTNTNNSSREFTNPSTETTSPSIEAIISSITTNNSSRNTTSPSTEATSPSAKTSNSSVKEVPTERLTTIPTKTVMLTIEQIKVFGNISNTSIGNPQFILIESPANGTLINESKTLEEIFEEERNQSNGSNPLLNEDTTQLNSTFITEIVPAGPGIPVFREPPAFVIHDPDEGPLDPFLHPSNDSKNIYSYPSTETPNQQFIMMNRPEFEPEKGSLEEKYKHLLINADDNIPLPSDSNTNTKVINNSNKILNITTTPTTTTTTTTTMNPIVWPTQPPLMSYPYPYSYGYNQYYPQYWPQYYGNGYYGNYYYPYLQQPYLGFQSNQYQGNENYGIPEFNTNNEAIEPQTTQKTLDEKLLPKSYQKYGAYITKVTLDEKQNKEVSTGDEDTLEVLGPIEWVATTTANPNTTLPNEIRFLINEQNINQLTRNKNKPIHEKRKKYQVLGKYGKLVPTFRPVQQRTDHRYREPMNIFNLWTTLSPYIERQLPSDDIQRRVSYRPSKVPPIKRRRIKVHRFVKINNSSDHNLNPNKAVGVRANGRRTSIRRRGHRVFGKQNTKSQTQRHKDIPKRLKNHKPLPVSEPKWKTTTKPKFLTEAKIKDLDKLKVDSLTGIKWWHQKEPTYCSEPIYLLSDCNDRRLTKRWSYDPSNKKCYLYEDYCSQFKANSFETSQECFRKCYRTKE